MSTKGDIAASVRARLNALAHKRGDDVQLVLTRYANEQLLRRLARSPHAEKFVLKGAALFTVWTGHAHRATRDMDFLGYGTPSPQDLEKFFRDLVTNPGPDDGVRFDAESVHAELIREDQEYGGVRVTLSAHLGKAKLRLQVDVGFGDIVTPGAAEVEFPPLLADHGPRIMAYPKETVVAEKVEAMVNLGLANSRMKDFFDVAHLANIFDFDGAMLVKAFHATLHRRNTPLPENLPLALTPVFSGDALKVTQWNAFVRKARIAGGGTLGDTVKAVASFVTQPLAAAQRDDKLWVGRWPKRGPWTA